MADEIKLQITNTVTNGDFKQTFQPGTVNITQSAVGMHAPIVIVESTGSQIPMGDISTPGIIVGRNLDATNFISIGPSTDGTEANRKVFMRVGPGETFAFRVDPTIAATALFGKANVADVKLQIQLFED